MAVAIRLKKIGKKNNPSFRVVVTDSRNPRDGRAIEFLGHYNPSEKSKPFAIDKDRYEYWLGVGAAPSEAVLSLVKGDYEFVPYEPHKKEETTPAAEPEASPESAESVEEEASEETDSETAEPQAEAEAAEPAADEDTSESNAEVMEDAAEEVSDSEPEENNEDPSVSAEENSEDQEESK